MLLIEKLSSLAVVFNSMAYNINSSIYNNRIGMLLLLSADQQ